MAHNIDNIKIYEFYVKHGKIIFNFMLCDMCSMINFAIMDLLLQ